MSFNSTFGGVGKATLSIEKDVLTYTITNYTPFINANMSVPKVIFFKKIVQSTEDKYSVHVGCDVNEKSIALCNLSGTESRGGITEVSTVKTKSNFFTLPNDNDNDKTSAYLVPGDKVRVIQTTSDNKWINIGYINSKGSPLISWIRVETLE